MAQKFSSPKVLLLVAGAVVLLFALLLFLPSRRSAEESSGDAGQTAAGQDEAAQEDQADDSRDDSGQNGQPRESEDEAQTTNQQESAENNSAAGRLPADWAQLTPAQQTTRNPLQCPVDENGIVHLSSETGECLPAADEVSAVPEEELAVQTDAFGQALAYDENSEVSVGGFSCHNLTVYNPAPGGINQTLAEFLETNWAEYERYRQSPSALVGSYLRNGGNFQRLDYYDYLQEFEAYLAADNPLTIEEFRDELFRYLHCEVFVTLKNIGPDTIFSDGCGLKFARPISLEGEARIYGEESRNQATFSDLACTQAEEPFPSGASDSDQVAFIVSAEDQLVAVLVTNAETNQQFRLPVEAP